MSRADAAPRAGFTLLEAVVALAILGSVSIASLGALHANATAMEDAGRVLVASSLAEDRLTALRILPPSELQPLPDSVRRGRIALGSVDYEWSTEIRSATAAPELLEVTVTVRWEGGSESLVTFLARRPR